MDLDTLLKEQIERLDAALDLLAEGRHGEHSSARVRLLHARDVASRLRCRLDEGGAERRDISSHPESTPHAVARPDS